MVKTDQNLVNHKEEDIEKAETNYDEKEPRIDSERQFHDDTPTKDIIYENRLDKEKDQNQSNFSFAKAQTKQRTDEKKLAEIILEERQSSRTDSLVPDEEPNLEQSRHTGSFMNHSIEQKVQSRSNSVIKAESQANASRISLNSLINQVPPTNVTKKEDKNNNV